MSAWSDFWSELKTKIINWFGGSEKEVTTNLGDVPSLPAAVPIPTVNEVKEITESDLDDSKDDVTALARMLASETSNYGARVVIGWITKEGAAKRGVDIYERLTGKTNEYGPQRRADGTILYASTRAKPTAETRDLALKIISTQIVPNKIIRDMGVGAWVEADQGLSAEKMIARQFDEKKGVKDFGGIYARIKDSKWYLYNQKADVIVVQEGQSAEDRLAQVPVIEAIDQSSYVA